MRKLVKVIQVKLRKSTNLNSANLLSNWMNLFEIHLSAVEDLSDDSKMKLKD